MKTDLINTTKTSEDYILISEEMCPDEGKQIGSHFFIDLVTNQICNCGIWKILIYRHPLIRLQSCYGITVIKNINEK